MIRSRKVDIYGCTLHLATTVDDALKLARRYDDPAGFDGEALGQTCSVLDTTTGAYHVLIFIDVALVPGRPMTLVNTCAHEAAHAAGFILRHYGLRPKHREAQTEQAAYLIGWIAGWIFDHCDAARHAHV